MEQGEGEVGKKTPIFRDVRRYYCEFCGICRSKKALIASHVLANHQDEIEEQSNAGNENDQSEKSNKCEECGACFRKPAHLKQHMLSHSVERSFSCPIDDCHSTYKRKDHLNRHLLQHEGKIFHCPTEGCKIQFAFQGNMTRHLSEFHSEESSSKNIDGPKQHVCPEVGCGKVFKYASKLKKHEASHVKLDSVEAFCVEPGCLKHFTNEHYLKVHMNECHSHITCDVCGTNQLRKNIKRHMQTHCVENSSERIKCTFEDCQHTFSTRSNLQQHVKAVHLAARPFRCSMSGCGMRFTFKHVRDKHEKSGQHLHSNGDFEESDEIFRSRPRGGRKRACPPIEALLRKRITPLNHSDSILHEGSSEYLSWLLSSQADD